MRKLYISILMLIYAFVQLGTYGWYFYKPVVHAICYNRIFSASGNKEENEYVIRMDITSYQKALQDKHEILWKGELYDIKNVVANGNEITLVAEKDITETRWMDVYAAIEQQVNKNSSQQPLTDTGFYKWIFKLYVPVEDVMNVPLACPVSRQNGSCLSQYISSFFPDGPCRPPDTLS